MLRWCNLSSSLKSVKHQITSRPFAQEYFRQHQLPNLTWMDRVWQVIFRKSLWIIQNVSLRMHWVGTQAQSIYRGIVKSRAFEIVTKAIWDGRTCTWWPMTDPFAKDNLRNLRARLKHQHTESWNIPESFHWTNRDISSILSFVWIKNDEVQRYFGDVGGPPRIGASWPERICCKQFTGFLG